MMKRRKIVFIIVLLMLTTGCGNVSYNIDIRRDKIYENLNIEIKNLELEESLQTLVEENINYYPEDVIKNTSYTVLNNTIDLNNWFYNIYSISNNELVSMLYEDVNVETNGELTTVILKNYNKSSFECGEFDEGCFLTLDKIEVNLVSEYEITSSNAEFVDTKNNKYTWILDINSDDIYFSYSNKILWNIVIKNYVREHYEMLTIVIVCSIIFIGVGIVIIKFLRKVKENNS